MTESRTSKGSGMRLQDIQKLISMLEGSGVNDLEVEMDGMKVRLSKGPSTAAPAPQPAAPQILMMPAPSGAPAVVPSAPTPAQPAQPLESAGPPASAPPRPANVSELKSPMVGTFYRAPAPGAEPFVKIGDRVRKGQTLCIIEAMKLMNEIECEVDGTVVDILTENAQPVEFGEPLLLIEPLS
jgi:acetyl-CoA carboxylase biotin carboxyl carrier protein